MGNKITICHWNNGGSWEAIEVSTSSLSGHDNHEMDIWAPIEGVTDGNNWPLGEPVYLNGCAIATVTPSPEPTPSPTSTLPDTGVGAGTGGAGIVAALLIAVGAALWRKGSKAKAERREQRKKGPHRTSGGPEDWGE